MLWKEGFCRRCRAWFHYGVEYIKFLAYQETGEFSRIFPGSWTLFIIIYFCTFHFRNEIGCIPMYMYGLLWKYIEKCLSLCLYEYHTYAWFEFGLVDIL